MCDLTIIIPLYNHQDYIAKALDSIFMQKTKYKYKIIIADDASSDSSLKIVKEYQEKHKNIKIMESKVNQKAFKNLLRAYKIIDTKYFCVLDSDDFYIDSNLIESGLDFLESNAEFSIYCADTIMKYEDSNNLDSKDSNCKEKLYIGYDKPQDSTFNDFLTKGCILGHTSATFYRNKAFGKNMSEKVLNLSSDMSEDSFRGESFRLLSHLYYGKIHFEPKVMSVYRVHNKGIWQGLDSLSQELLNANFYKDMWLYFDKKHDKLLLKSYEIYNKIFSNPQLIKNIFLALENDSLRKSAIKQTESLKALNCVFNENKAILESKIDSKKIKLKYRILKKIHDKLDKKLTKKNLLKKQNSIDLKDIFTQAFL